MLYIYIDGFDIIEMYIHYYRNWKEKKKKQRENWTVIGENKKEYNTFYLYSICEIVSSLHKFQCYNC